MSTNGLRLLVFKGAPSSLVPANCMAPESLSVAPASTRVDFLAHGGAENYWLPTFAQFLTELEHKATQALITVCEGCNNMKCGAGCFGHL